MVVLQIYIDDDDEGHDREEKSRHVSQRDLIGFKLGHRIQSNGEQSHHG